MTPNEARINRSRSRNSDEHEQAHAHAHHGNCNHNHDELHEHSLQAADELLSKELLQLSFKDRNDIQEEIHGVKCIAVEETPELIHESLKKLAQEIDHNLPASQKFAYFHATMKMTSSNSNSNSSSSQTPQKKTSYIHDEAFRLQFLRCDLFNVRKAAIRMCKYLDCLVDYFGLYALSRPIKLSDFTSTEMKAFRKGFMQLLPFRDRSNRRIFVLFPSSEFLKIDDRISIKIILYIYQVLVCDIETQMKGLVILLWYDKKFKINAKPDIKRIKMLVKIHEASPVRISAVHMCFPDTPIFRFRQSILTIAIGQNRSRMKIHLGESVEVTYLLNGYGIPSNSVPISWTGIIKRTYLKRWLKIRQTLEETTPIAPMMSTSTHTANNSNNNKTQEEREQQRLRLVECLVECPYLDDVIFKKGTSAIHHPGNVKFRSLIQSKYEQQLELGMRAGGGGILALQSISSNNNADATSSSSSTASNLVHVTASAADAAATTKESKLLMKSLVTSIIEEIQQQNLRVLNWNEKESCWIRLDDEKHIHKKVDYIVKEFKFSTTTKNKAAQKKMMTLINRKVTKTTTTTHLRSSTSMFLEASPSYRDNNGGCGGGSGCNNRQRQQAGTTDDSDESDVIMGGCVSDCFSR